MRCPQCGTDNASGNLLCSQCRTPLLATAPAGAPAPATAPATAAAAPSPTTPLPLAAPYKPSGICPPSTLGKMIPAALVGGLLTGVVYHLIARFIDLLIVFPLAAGFLCGAGLAVIINSGQCRNVLKAGTLGAIAGLLAYATKIGCDAWQARPEMVQSISEVVAKQHNVTVEQARPVVEQAIGPWDTVTMFLQAEAEVGIGISHNGSSSGSITLAGPWFWLLTVVETLLVAGTAASVASKAAGSPYCEQCQQWWRAVRLYRVHPSQGPALLEKVRAGDWKGAAAVPAGKPDDKHKTTAILACCDNCLDARVIVATTGGKVPGLYAAVAPESAAALLGRQEPLPARAVASTSLPASSAPSAPPPAAPAAPTPPTPARRSPPPSDGPWGTL